MRSQLSKGAIALAIALVGSLFLSTTASASSSDEKVDPRGEITNGQPTAIVIAGAGGQTMASWSARATSGGASWSCRYHPFVGNGGYDVTIDYEATPDLEAGVQYALVCTDADGSRVYTQLVLWEPGDPFSGVAAAERAADEALATLTVPTPAVEMSPPANVDHLVGLDTWFWLTTWAPASATATLGTTSSTVTIVPRSVTYTFGDGGADLTCTGPGTPYQPGATTDCAHRWKARSTTHSATRSAGTFDVTATLTWHTTWSATNGQTGDLGTLTSTTTTAIRVVEAQAVVDY